MDLFIIYALLCADFFIDTGLNAPNCLLIKNYNGSSGITQALYDWLTIFRDSTAAVGAAAGLGENTKRGGVDAYHRGDQVFENMCDRKGC